MKTLEEVIDKMKHYHTKLTIANNEQTIAFCEGVIQALGWAYNLPYWDMDALNGSKD